MNPTVKSLLFWVVLVVVGVLIWNFSTKYQTRDHQLTFSEFMTQVDAGNVSHVVITGQEVTGVTKDNPNQTFRSYAPTQYEGLANKLIERGVASSFCRKGFTVPGVPRPRPKPPRPSKTVVTPWRM